MAVGDSQDVAIGKCVQALGLTLISEWDVLAFLYRHAVNLGTAAQIAQLIGYDKADIGFALNRLESLRLIHRSRVSQGIRIYRVPTSLEPSRKACLLELINLAHNREGRMMLLNQLKRPVHELRERRRSGLGLA